MNIEQGMMNGERGVYACSVHLNQVRDVWDVLAGGRTPLDKT